MKPKFALIRHTAKSTRAFAGRSLVLGALLGLLSPSVFAQSTYTWSTTTTSTAWMNSNNWTGGPENTFAGVDANAVTTADGNAGDIAVFTTLAFGGNSLGINFNNTGTENGVGNNGNANGSLTLAALDFNPSKAVTIGKSDSSTFAATLTFGGATLGGIENTILRNSSATTVTLAGFAGGSGIEPMALVLGNATDNIVQINNIATVAISANITGTAPLTKAGTGTGPFILSGTNSYTGGTTVSTGTLSFNTIAAKSTGTHTFAAGTTLGLGFGGATRFTDVDIQNAFAGSFTGNLAGISIGSTNNIAIDTTGGAQTFSASIGPSDRGLEKILGGANLAVTGANQYAGRTIVWGGSALRMNDPGNIGDPSSNLGTNSTVDLMSGSFFEILAPAPVASNRNLNVLGNTVIFGAGTAANTITLSGNISTETAGPKLVDFRTNVVGTHTFSGVISDGSGTLNVRKSNNGTWTLSGENTHSGTTTVAAGTLILANSLALQNSILDTTGSVAGTATAGLRTTETALTIGGLSGNKNLASVFTTTSGGYDAVTALTLNPVTSVPPVYTAVIANGAAGMTLTKTGTGTQTLSGVNTYTGATTISAGTLALGASGTIANSPSLTINAAGTLDVSAKATHAISASQPVTFGINPAGSGTSGRIVANGLDITNAAVTISPAGTLDDPAYVLATYTAPLTGAAFASVTGLPLGYELDYDFEGDKIALVSTGAPPASPFETWAGPGVTFDGDANGDGISNGLAFLLGASGPNANALDNLPQPAESGGGLVMTFQTLTTTARGTAQLMLEYSNSLAPGSWTTVTVPDSAGVTVDGAVTFTLTGTGPLDVTATISADAANGAKLFGRVKATRP